jgi:hypothetical protein
MNELLQDALNLLERIPPITIEMDYEIGDLITKIKKHLRQNPHSPLDAQIGKTLLDFQKWKEIDTN